MWPTQGTPSRLFVSRFRATAVRRIPAASGFGQPATMPGMTQPPMMPSGPFAPLAGVSYADNLANDRRDPSVQTARSGAARRNRRHGGRVASRRGRSGRVSILALIRLPRHRLPFELPGHGEADAGGNAAGAPPPSSSAFLAGPPPVAPEPATTFPPPSSSWSSGPAAQVPPLRPRFRPAAVDFEYNEAATIFFRTRHAVSEASADAETPPRNASHIRWLRPGHIVKAPSDLLGRSSAAARRAKEDIRAALREQPRIQTPHGREILRRDENEAGRAWLRLGLRGRVSCRCRVSGALASDGRLRGANGVLSKPQTIHQSSPSPFNNPSSRTAARRR